MLLALAIVLGAPAAGGGSLTPDYVRAADALIGVAFPGAARDWRDERLVWPDGRREQLALAGFTWQAAPGGWWIVAAVEFPDRLARETRRLKTTRAPAETVRSRIVLVRADAEFRVLAHKQVEVDPESPLSGVHKLEIVAPAEGGSWPDVDVTASSAGLAAGEVVVVGWRGRLDGETLAWVERWPRSFLRQEADGRVTEDLIEARVEAGRTTFRGVSSGVALPGNCDANCRIAPLAVLEPSAAR